MSDLIRRRALLSGLGLTGLSACATTGATPSAPLADVAAVSGIVRPHFQRPAFAPLDARPERLSRVTVCLRPFRGAGPRIEAEAFGDKRLVHNYGHGGSGWSLSWGSAQVARDLVMAGGARDVAVIGCGAIGLTTALTLLRAGAAVTIYAAERTPFTRSARATGVWSPDSRVAASDQIAPDFPDRWEAMARASWAMHHTHVGLDGDPVRFLDNYILRDEPGATGRPPRPAPRIGEGQVPFVAWFDRIRDLTPTGHDLTKDQHPFPVASARTHSMMTFNVAEYAHHIATDFLMEGGRIETRVFNHPSELSGLSQPVIVNCTGYGARALFGDDSIVPVRGQIAWLVPQPEVAYALYYRGVSMVPRADGIVVQATGGEMAGYNIDDETPDRTEAEQSVAVLASLYDGRAF